LNDHPSAPLSPVIHGVHPGAGIEGGEVIITTSGYDTSDYAGCQVRFGERRGRLVSGSPSRVIAAVPETPIGFGAAELSLIDRHETARTSFITGRKLAEHLHPVTNPAIDREDGSVYVTLSGTRGQTVPVSIFKITTDGTVSPFLSEIVNPTGLAFGQEGDLYVTSRFEGTLYRVTPFKEVQTLATDLGIATGIAIAPSGEIYVGDRNGTIHRLNDLGESRPFASIEPSVSAFHLAFGPGGDLYVTGPTVSSYESVMRVDFAGNVRPFYTGLGRPQGLAFDRDGNLYVAASLHGHRGIVRITADGRHAEIVVSGGSIVGLALDDQGRMIVASTERIYELPLGIRGYSPW
ncbi:MAG: gluconolaconase, partial [Acidobacteriota bacterium]